MKIDKYLLNFGPAVILTHPGLLQQDAPPVGEVAPPPPPPPDVEGEDAAIPAEEVPAEEVPAEEAPAEEVAADASAELEADARDLEALRWGVRGSFVFTQGTETGAGFQIAGGPRFQLAPRLRLDVDGVFRQLWYPGSPDATTASSELSREGVLGMVDDPNDVYAVVPYDAIQGGLLETSDLLDSTDGQQFLVNAALMFALNESGTLQLGPFLGAGVARRAYERTSDRTVTVRGPTGEDYREEHYGPGEGNGCIPGDDFCGEAPIPEPNITEPGERHDFVRSLHDVVRDAEWGPLVQGGTRFMASSEDGTHSFVLDVGIQNDVLNGGPEFLATAGYEWRFDLGGSSQPVRREEPVEEARVPTEEHVTATLGNPIRVPAPREGWTAGMVVRVNGTDVSVTPGSDPLLIDADLLNEGENRIEVVNADDTVRSVYILTLTAPEAAPPEEPEVVAVERTVTVAGANILVTPGATAVNKGATAAQTIVTLHSDRDATATITLDNGSPQEVQLQAHTPYSYQLTADQINAAGFTEGAHNVTVRLGGSDTIYSFPFTVAAAAPEPAQATHVTAASITSSANSYRGDPLTISATTNGAATLTIELVTGSGRVLGSAMTYNASGAGTHSITVLGRNEAGRLLGRGESEVVHVRVTPTGGTAYTIDRAITILGPRRQGPPPPPAGDEPAFGGDAR